jgi:NAD(P)-dependent dehydrogenase (short-subunit alcohol dehydrogenase family)
MERFDGKIALIAGAGGLAGATAKRLALEGAAVALLDIDLAAAEEAVREVTAAGGKGLALRGDLSDESSLRQAVESTVDELGGIDLLLNNGYVGSANDLDIVETTDEVWDRIHDVNFRGYVRMCRLVIPHMLERGGGSAIVNMSSGTAIVAEQVRIAYATSKYAIIGMTRNVAMEFAAKGIRCNVVAPGFIGTPSALADMSSEYVDFIGSITPVGRIAQPEDIAAVVCFLLSEDAAYITGQLIIADGGYSVAAYHGPAAEAS